jgi:hypothetical protein
VTCSCGEIAVDGGTSYHRARFNNIENFICIDDEGNEILPAYKPSKEEIKEIPIKAIVTNKEELLGELDAMIKNIENLPAPALYAPINHADFCSLLMLLHAILRNG